MRSIRPITAAVLAALSVWACAEPADPVSLVANPSEGFAPLTVTFTVITGLSSSAVITQSGDNVPCIMTYGDGEGVAFGDEGGGQACAPSFDLYHTYTMAGEYEAVFELRQTRATPHSAVPTPQVRRATVRVFSPANAAPVAADDSAMTTRGSAVTVDVLANDSDPDGDALSVTALTVSPADTAIRVTNPGDGTLVVDPGAMFVGTIDVAYTVSDGRGGEAMATLSVEVAPSPGAGPVVVEVVDPSNRPQDPTAIAARIGLGMWGALSASAVGQYRFDAPAGDERLEVAVLCAPTPNDGTIQTFAFTRNDADSIKASCPELSPTTLDIAFTWQGLDNLGVGSYAGLVHGREGFLGGAVGATGTINLQVPARVQDFILVGDVNNAFAGAEIRRDVSPTTGASLDFTFSAASAGSTEQVGPFATPSGFNGSFATWWVTRGGGIFNAGSGTSSGGSYFTVPDPARLAGDLYFGTAVASKPGAQVSDTHVFGAPVPYGFSLPDTSELRPPTPSRTPRLDFSAVRAGAVLFEASLQRLSSPSFVWQLVITPTVLDATNAHRVADLAVVPGFEAFALGSGDVVAWRVGEIFSNLPFSQIARGLRKVGVPLREGLSMQTASRSGAYPVP